MRPQRNKSKCKKSYLEPNEDAGLNMCSLICPDFESYLSLYYFIKFNKKTTFKLEWKPTDPIEYLLLTKQINGGFGQFIFKKPPNKPEKHEPKKPKKKRTHRDDEDKESTEDDSSEEDDADRDTTTGEIFDIDWMTPVEDKQDDKNLFFFNPRVLSISVWSDIFREKSYYDLNTQDDKIDTVCLKFDNENVVHIISCNPGITDQCIFYEKCKVNLFPTEDEAAVFNTLEDFFKQPNREFDFISGLNTFHYDLYYLILRARKLFGKEFPNFLMPVTETANQIRMKRYTLLPSKKQTNRYNGCEICYVRIPGVTIIDLQMAKNQSRPEIYEQAGLVPDNNMFSPIYDVYVADKITSESFKFMIVNMCTAHKTPPLQFLSKGQTFKTESMIRHSLYTDYTVFIEPNKPEDANFETFKGGLKMEPKKGYYTDPVVILDYNSLYPSVIISENVDHSTKQYKDASNEKQISFKSPDETEGVVPRLLREILKKRTETKKRMKEIQSSSPEDYMFHNALQEAYKLAANSVYGSYGSRYSVFYNNEIAAFITRRGREILTNTISLFEKHQNEFNAVLKRNLSCTVITADTDSVFIVLNGEKDISKNDLKKIEDNFPSKIQNLLRLPPTITIKHETTSRATLIYDTAMYALHINDRDHIEVKGINLLNSSVCNFLREFATECILNHEDQTKIELTLETFKRKLDDKQIDKKDLVYRNKISLRFSDYEPPLPPFVAAAKRWSDSKRRTLYLPGDYVLFLKGKTEEIIPVDSPEEDINYDAYKTQLDKIKLRLNKEEAKNPSSSSSESMNFTGNKRSYETIQAMNKEFQNRSLRSFFV